MAYPGIYNGGGSIIPTWKGSGAEAPAAGGEKSPKANFFFTYDVLNAWEHVLENVRMVTNKIKYPVTQCHRTTKLLKLNINLTFLC